MENKRTAIC